MTTLDLDETQDKAGASSPRLSRGAKRVHSVHIDFFADEVPQCRRCKAVFSERIKVCPHCRTPIVAPRLLRAPFDVHVLGWVDRLVGMALLYEACMVFDIVVRHYLRIIVEDEFWLWEFLRSCLACWPACLLSLILCIMATLLWVLGDWTPRSQDKRLIWLHRGVFLLALLRGFASVGDLATDGTTQLLVLSLFLAAAFLVPDSELPRRPSTWLLMVALGGFLLLLVPWGTVLGGAGFLMLDRKATDHHFLL